MAYIDSIVELMQKHGGEFVTLRSNNRMLLRTPRGDVPIGAQPLLVKQLYDVIAAITPEKLKVKLTSDTSFEFAYVAPLSAVKVKVDINGGEIVVILTPIQSREPALKAPLDEESKINHSAEAEKTVAQTAPVSVTPPQHDYSQMAPLERLFHQMLDLKASDLHISSRTPPMVRVDGQMQIIQGALLFEPDELEKALLAIMPERNQSEFHETADTDFAYNIPERARLRSNVFRDMKGPGAVFRQIPSRILSAKDLNLPESVLSLCTLHKGLVIVTGPTGSGKSTTLAAMIDHINETRHNHILTIEDPVEFVHTNKNCLINHRELGTHTKSFKAALRAALREDPDIVMVGELRDLETVSIALETAETGHLVFGTLHTNTAASTIDRLVDQFPSDRQAQVRTMLSTSLRGVIAQALCKKLTGGRVAALEILVITAAMSNLIREGKTFQIPSLMQTGKADGNVLLADSLLSLVRAKTIAPEEAYACAVDRKEMASLLTRSGFRGPWSEA